MQYSAPDFLANQNAEEIHRRMLDALPADIYKSENQIPWDFTRPAAVEKAEFVQYELNETVKTIFPHWASGVWLDYHAEASGLTRRVPNRAAGDLSIRGKPGTVLESGTVFSTPANIAPGVLFESVEAVTLDGTPDSNGEVAATVPVRAVNGGVSGNLPPDSIILMLRPIQGVSYVTNLLPMSGGTPEESDDELRQRILSTIQLGMSFTGCDADYVRWAREISGVGWAIADPEWDGPGTVRLFILDANGQPANRQITDAVYDYIISPGNRMQRLAPIGATLTVASPEPLALDVSVHVTLLPGESFQTVTERIRAGLGAYCLEAAGDIYGGLTGGSVHIKYVYIGAILTETAGVSNYDHGSLTLNGGTEDVLIPLGMFPVVREVRLE